MLGSLTDQLETVRLAGHRGHPAGTGFGREFLRSLLAVDLDCGFHNVRAVGQVEVGVHHLKVNALTEHNPL